MKTFTPEPQAKQETTVKEEKNTFSEWFSFGVIESTTESEINLNSEDQVEAENFINPLNTTNEAS